MRKVSSRTSVTLRASLIVFCVALLAACSGSSGPSSSDISKALSMQMPTGMAVADVSVKVANNIGSKDNPEYKTRSDIKLEFTQDIFQKVGTLAGKTVVKKTMAKGATISGTAITTATRRSSGGWDVTIDTLDVPTVSGMAQSQFAPGSYVVAGSDAYKGLQAKLAAAKAKAEATAKQKLAAFKKQIVGTWAAQFPMLHDGSVWASRNNRKVGIQIRFDPTDGMIGTGEGVLYDYETPAREAKVPVGYVIDPSEKFVTLNFTSDVQAPGVGFTIYHTTKWTFTPDGKLVAKGYNDNWVVQMQRNGPALKKRLAEVKKYDNYAAAENKLARKYAAANAQQRFRDLPLDDNTSGNFFVMGYKGAGGVYGAGVYGGNSYVEAAVVHAGVLKDHQAGIVKITCIRARTEQGPFDFKSTTRHGITSRQGSSWTVYKVSLVKALPVYKP